MFVVAFLVGLLAAWPINRLADSLPPDALGGRRAVDWSPACPYCGQPYARRWAVAAWLTRAADCRNCGAPRPARHVIVEVAAAAGAGLLWIWSGEDLLRFGAAAIVGGIFMLITVIDIEHRLVLWRTVWPSALILLALEAAMPDRDLIKSVIGGLAGYGIVLVLFLLGQGYGLAMALLRGEPLDEVVFGGGDVNLAGLVGLAVGWSGVLFALALAVLVGGLYAIGHILVQALQRRYRPHAAIPYGPFLVLGGLAIYLYGPEFAAWYLAR